MSRIPKQALTPLIIFIIAASLAQGTQRHFVSYMAIKKEKEVTLNPLLPDVCDSYLLICGRPATRNPSRNPTISLTRYKR